MDECDIEKIFLKLKECLKEIKIDVEIEVLKKASLKRVDFCKNFKVPYHLGTSTSILHLLSKYNIKRSSGFRKTEYYQNKEGNVLKFWNNTQGFVIYDKISEIFSNGWTEIDEAIKNKFVGKDFENSIIRFELSLQKKQSLNAFLRSRLKNKKKSFVLSDVMDEELVKKIMLEKFNEIFKDVYTMTFSFSEMDENKLERYLLEENLNIREHERLFYWIKKSVSIGIKNTLHELENRYSKSTLNRYKAELIRINKKIEKKPCDEGKLTTFFKSELNKFDILKPK